MTLRKRALLILLIATAAPVILLGQTEDKPLILQEMSWVDVQEYLKGSDMVIIPLGSTEQHGPHLPLGTDFFEALEICKKISARTGVLVAPIILAGYSEYHSGFPGTLSLKPETMEQAVFECVEMLLKYGFRRFLFFNYHGGNNIVQANLIHRINHETEGVAVALGVGSSLPSEESEDSEFFDWHAGLSETSIMLYLKPELVRVDRIEKPVITFTPKMKELLELAKTYPELMIVFNSLTATPAATGKGGASHQLSSNGIWSFSDVETASAEIGRTEVEPTVEAAVRFINTWKAVEK